MRQTILSLNGFLACIFLLLASPLRAQVPNNQDTLYLCKQAVVETDSFLFMDIQVANFVKLASLQFTVAWDKSKIVLEEVLNLNPHLSQPPLTTPVNANLDSIIVSWFDAEVMGNTLTDGEVLFSMKFKKLSNDWSVEWGAYKEASKLDGDPLSPQWQSVPVAFGSKACIPLFKELLEVGVVLDEDENCQADIGEALLGGWPVWIMSGTDTIKVFTPAGGNPSLLALPVGDYTLKTQPPIAYFDLCDTFLNVTLAQDQPAAVKFPATVLIECPLMRVTATTPFLRRCFANKIRLTYCNEGSVPANNAQLQVQLDEFMIPMDTTLPWSGPDGKQLVLDLGTVPPGTCGDFVLDVEISCDAELGQTHCLSAKVFPDTICLPAGPSWTGSNIEVRAKESGDTLITFHIENTGSGDMLNPLNYTLVENDQLLNEGSFQLTAGESMPVAVECTGATYRLIAAQEADHPYAPASPTVAVEGCGSMPVLGFVTQFPEDRSDPSFFRMCQENIGSYDPNDKQAIPHGVGIEHFIAPGTQLEYLIRFQNTGTDTAFRVEIRDTLSTSLDLTTLQPMSSSHSYRWEQKGQELVFIFDDILLPDSVTDLAGSQGYVQFRAAPRTEAPLGTVITNSAAIYFDFNEPIFTNTVFHTLGLNFLTVATYEAEHVTMPLKVYPNPAVEYAVLELPADWQAENDPLQLEIFDWTGRILRREVVRSRLHQVQRNGLPAGSYGFALRNNAEVVSRGILVWQ